MRFDIRIFVSTFPGICVALGVLLLLSSQYVNSSEFSAWGWDLITIGAVFQALYLSLRFRKQYTE